MAKKSLTGRAARAAGRAALRAIDKRHPEYCARSSNNRHHGKAFRGKGGHSVTYCGDCGRVL